MSLADNALDPELATAIEDLARPTDVTAPGRGASDGDPRQLVLEFDEAYTTYVDNLDYLPAEPQLRSLQALDAALTAMTGPENADLWSGDAFRRHPRWVEIRELATAVLASFR